MPEFCSSYTFPKTFGPAVSAQMLYLGESLSAEEAKHVGLVSAIFPVNNFVESVIGEIRPTADLFLSKESWVRFKALVKTPEEIARLEAVHKMETLELDNRAIGSDSDISKAVEIFQRKAAERKKKNASKL